MYRDVPFRTEPLDQIARDLEEARMFRPHERRVFLVNGDAFALDAESGLGSVLERMNKGYAPDQALRSLQRLDGAGMRYGVNVILGAAGAGNGRENADATAGLLNQTGVSLIFTGTIHADPGCPRYEDMRSGAFEESDLGGYLLEEQRLLERLQVEDCLLFGLHPSNVVALHGYLPADRDKMLLQIEKARQRLGGHLNERPRRFGEGGIILPR